MSMRWYVVHAYSGFENQVMRMLKERIERYTQLVHEHGKVSARAQPFELHPVQRKLLESINEDGGKFSTPDGSRGEMELGYVTESERHRARVCESERHRAEFIKLARAGQEDPALSWTWENILARLQLRIEDLEQNLEKFAREKYLMHKQDEEIFIIDRSTKE